MHAPPPSTTTDLFARRGLRCTRQRRIIYDALAAASTHPTAEELLALVRSRDRGRGGAVLSLATVYNALEAFAGAGLCRRVRAAAPGDGAAAPCRFDADMTEHVHLLGGDGRVRDLPEDLGDALLDAVPPDVLARIEHRMGVRIDRVSMDVVAAEGPSGGRFLRG